tara:strand:- start:1109 stop:1369 length:261 start_codon:yes stop_codon:yes gene_type:complete
MSKVVNPVILASKSVLIAVALNIGLAFALSPFATPDEIKPPNGAQNLSFKSQFMHMLVHHKQVLFTSSLIVAIVVALSISLGFMWN